MKKLIAILLTVMLLTGCCAALAESAESMYDLLRVGTIRNLKRVGMSQHRKPGGKTSNTESYSHYDILHLW